MAKCEWFVVQVTDNGVVVEKASRRPRYVLDAENWGGPRDVPLEDDGWSAAGFVAGALGIVDTSGKE